MTGITLKLLLFIAIVLGIDLYDWRGILSLAKKWPFLQKKWFSTSYLILSVSLLSALLLAVYIKIDLGLRLAIIILFFVAAVFKACFALFLLIDDLRRLMLRLTGAPKEPTQQTIGSKPKGNAIPRSEFLVKAGLLAGAVPLAAFKLNMS